MEGLKETTESRYFNRFFLILSLFVFTVAVIRSITVPFCNDESITFFQFVQKGDFLPYGSIVMATDHFLNSFLTWICFHLFGDSPLSLRLPNILGLVVLIFATYRLAGKLTQSSSKIILVAGLLLSFHWLSFFNMCRGYGLSMAFMVFAFTYILDFIENKRPTHILKIYILLDLAVCANLTLILTVAIITCLICFFQLYRRNFFKTSNLGTLFIHVIVLLFWIKYLFFLQHLHRLYAGPGEGGYWQVTFVTLINAIAGRQNLLINLSVIGAYFVIMLMGAYFLFKRRKITPSSPMRIVLFLALLLNGLLIGVYLLKKFLGINYPEDRTALLFYLLFILNAAFIIDLIKPYFSKPLAFAVLAVFTVHYAFSLNLDKHPLRMYSTIPQRFYDDLLAEQKQSRQRITIQGNDFFEPIYGFMNYKHDGALNYMDWRDSMLMDADYYIGAKRARKYYLPYYKEIDSDKNNDFVLLKRKEPLVRVPVFALGEKNIGIDINEKYFNFFQVTDTVFSKPNPLMVEVNFKVLKGDMPSFFWIILSIDSAEGKTAFYGRIPFNRLNYNYIGGEDNEDIILETGILPKKVHRLICYLWNVEHQQLGIKMNSVRVFQLEGSGACVRAPSIEIIPPK